MVALGRELKEQQSGLSTLGQGRIPTGVGAIASPQADAALRSGLPEQDGCYCMEDYSAQGSWWLFLLVILNDFSTI